MRTYPYSPQLLRLGMAATLLLGLVFTLLTRPTASAAPGDYTVSGNKVLDPNGNVYYIHGIARSGYETSATGDGHFTQTDMNNIHNWNANTVRIAFNESYMLSDSACYDPNYLGRLDAAVTAANNAGMNVIFDLHWNTPNTTGCATSQQNMADRRSLTAWNIMANRYKTNKTIFFELYNEPHDISWSVWKNGDGTWAGMQEMYNTVRNAGFTNLVLIGGLNWAYDLSGVPSNRPTGYGIVYVTHPYDFAGKQPADWPTGFGFLTSTDPVIASEFGQFNCGTNYVTALLNYMDAPAGDTNRRMGWTGWAWNGPGSCGWPSIINDWNGTPSTMGQPEHDRLIGYGNPPPTPTRTNTPTGPTNTPTRTNTPAGPTNTPSAGTIRVESGGTANFTDTSGNVWAADNSFTGGSTVDRGAIAIANTNDDRIYQTERYGNPFSYAFNVANGTYTVNLHFAETFFTSSGQRVFSVTAEGATIVSNLDIFASAGANAALIRTANVTVNDGQLNLNFTASVNNALVNGIEIIPSTSPTATPTRTNTPVGPTNTPTRTNTPTSGNTHGGTWAIRGTLPAAANFKNISQVPSVTGSSTYVASVWIKGAGSVQLYIKNGNWGADISGASVQCNATGTWQQCSTPSFSTGSNTQLTYILQNSYNTAGTMYLDDLFLGVSGGTNRLTNPGLESGNVNWFSSDGTVWTILQP